MPKSARPRARPRLPAALTPPQAVKAAGLILFRYDAASDHLALDGALERFGLGPLQGASLSALSAHLAAGDVGRLSTGGPALSPLSFSVTPEGAETSLWRGAWLADQRSIAGVILAPTGTDATPLDPLTGLLPRSAFLAALAEALKAGRGQRLVVGDLARMRRLNDALGYARADQVLSALGQRLNGAFPPAALPARVGDNCFAVLVSIDAPDAADTLRRALERPLTVEGMRIFPVLAVAEAVTDPSGNDDADTLLRRAEMALGEIKATNRTRLAAPLTAPLPGESLSRLTLEGELRDALAHGEIEPFYQPIISLQSGALAGFETLVRWRHPRRGLLPPDDFLPLVSEGGLMAEMGLFVVGAAARQARLWIDGHGASRELFVSVNLTTADLERDSLVAEVGAILREVGLPVGALKLEITEGEVMRDPDRAVRILNGLKAQGASLSLDDFGMGFSSLSWLSRLPIDGLKIDRYFVRTMGSSAGSAKIVRSVVNLARDFNIDVVAEGVENAAMADGLREIGCRYGQGFGYAPAMSAEEASVFLIECAIDGATMAGG